MIELWEEGVTKSTLGTNTYEAMAHGVLASVKGVVSDIQVDLMDQFGIEKEEIDIKLSGGFSKLLESHWNVDDELIVCGAKVMVLGGSIFK